MSEPAAPCANCGERDWRENIGRSPERPCPACGSANEPVERRQERDPWFQREPLLHSGITDCLPDDHPLAHESVYCQECKEMVHAFNNENMQAWFETEQGPFCLKCFARIYNEFDRFDRTGQGSQKDK